MSNAISGGQATSSETKRKAYLSASCVKPRGHVWCQGFGEVRRVTVVYRRWLQQRGSLAEHFALIYAAVKGGKDQAITFTGPVNSKFLRKTPWSGAGHDDEDYWVIVPKRSERLTGAVWTKGLHDRIQRALHPVKGRNTDIHFSHVYEIDWCRTPHDRKCARFWLIDTPCKCRFGLPHLENICTTSFRGALRGNIDGLREKSFASQNTHEWGRAGERAADTAIIRALRKVRLLLAEKVVAVLRDGSAGTVVEKKLAKAVKEGIFVRVHGISGEISQGFSIAFSGNAPSELTETIKGSKTSHGEVVDAIYSLFSLPPVVLHRKRRDNNGDYDITHPFRYLDYDPIPACPVNQWSQSPARQYRTLDFEETEVHAAMNGNQGHETKASQQVQPTKSVRGNDEFHASQCTTYDFYHFPSPILSTAVVFVAKKKKRSISFCQWNFWSDDPVQAGRWEGVEDRGEDGKSGMQGARH
ncbi:hypothetical protein IW262DRAFT_1300534 [Armillaria fumosa]|nr:hypothetical protein IW262DRAFT_1300534 [Armillaria fumosa]